MTEKHIKKLESLKEKRKAIQDQEDEIRQQLTLDFANFLIDADAFDHVEFDIIVGGLLDILEKAKRGDKNTEVWKLAGQKFRQQRKKNKSQRNSSKAKKVA